MEVEETRRWHRSVDDRRRQPELAAYARASTKNSLPIGTEIVVDGYQARDHTLKRANGRNITYPTAANSSSVRRERERRAMAPIRPKKTQEDEADARCFRARLDPTSLSMRRRIWRRPDGRAAAHERCRRTERLRPRCLMALPAGRQDACAVDLTTTIVHANGSLTREAWTPASNAPIDCFYVYPTVSTDPTPMSDMVADDAERNVIRQQFARFGSSCRLFAPMYRQVTLAGLRSMLAGGGGGGALSRGPQYDDVRDAWRYYLEHDNRGRGVVLVGHSQGSFILAELIRHGDRRQASTVASRVGDSARCDPASREGKDVGGSFKNIPLCRARPRPGCRRHLRVVSLNLPPPPNARVRAGSARTMEWPPARNPVALAGGSSAVRRTRRARSA